MRQRGMWLFLVISAVSVLAGCSSGSGGSGSTDVTDVEDQSAVDSVVDVPADIVADVAVDVSSDAANDNQDMPDGDAADGQPDPYAFDPDDPTFVAGVAELPTFAPIGIPTAGYGQEANPNAPHSPFTSNFVAAMRQHTRPMAKALYLAGSGNELLMIRIDKIGTTAPMLDEVTRRLTKITGRDWDDKVILASNHTHLGPGRLWELWIGDFANGPFWPYYYNMYIDDIVDAALAAIVDAQPARIGFGKTQCPEVHNDRRCENPVLLDSTMWLARIETTDGTLRAVLINYAIHGTVLHYSDSVLSGDAPAMIEAKLAEQFDHNVPVLLFQSWAGDVSPGDPALPLPEDPVAGIPDSYNRLERIGFVAAQKANELLPTIETTDQVSLGSFTARLPFDWTLMGYGEGEWPFPYGAMLCGTNEDAHCWGEPGPPPNMLACLPLTPDVSMNQITLSAAFVNDVMMVTMPGEPLTDWALEGLHRVAEATGFSNVLAIGYAQDHWGYLMKEYDYLLGGYEPTVAAWGPKQGEYMQDLIVAVATGLAKPEANFPYQERPMLPQPPLTGAGYEPMASSSEPVIDTQPAPTPAANEMMTIVFRGGDPWLGLPQVHLQRLVGDSWENVLRRNGTHWNNETYLFETSLEMIPSWNDDKTASTRQFHWTVSLPLRRNVPTLDTLPAGTYRFNIETPYVLKKGDTPSTATLHSESFVVP